MYALLINNVYDIFVSQIKCPMPELNAKIP